MDSPPAGSTPALTAALDDLWTAAGWGAPVDSDQARAACDRWQAHLAASVSEGLCPFHVARLGSCEHCLCGIAPCYWHSREV